MIVGSLCSRFHLSGIKKLDYKSQIIPLEQKGITVRLDVNVDAYPNNLNIAVLIRVFRTLHEQLKNFGPGKGDEYCFHLFNRMRVAIPALLLILTRKLIQLD